MPKRKHKKKEMKAWKYDKRKYACHGGTGCGYFLGFIGALVYYIQQSTSFWNGVLGILKALVWPAFLVHKLLGL